MGIIVCGYGQEVKHFRFTGYIVSILSPHACAHVGVFMYIHIAITYVQ